MTIQLQNQPYEPNNYIVLTGNTGTEAQQFTSSKTGKDFVIVPLYTSNSYKDKEGNINDVPPSIHNIMAFSPMVMKELLSFKSGVRLRIEGKLTYRTFKVLVDGQTVTRKRAIVVAKKVDQAAIPSKRKSDQNSTAVSKDLQYYPTPQNVIQTVINNLDIKEGSKVLEPSCGCGRFMDALRSKGADVCGIEYDTQRVNECKAKGHQVLEANFLETEPEPIYDYVVMNPPFNGRHYAQHVKHALKFLKSGGKLTSILPAGARYEHGLLDGQWQDLPNGSFKESGANIDTTVLTITK